MKKIVAATLFCATIAVPAVAQGPHPLLAQNGASSTQLSTAAANMVPVSGAVAAPVSGAGLYGGDLANGKPAGQVLPLRAGPAPSIAWVLALGFLALVILRRTRSSNGF